MSRQAELAPIGVASLPVLLPCNPQDTWYVELSAVPWGKQRKRVGGHRHYDDTDETNRLVVLDLAIREAGLPRFEGRVLQISWRAIFPRPLALQQYLKREGRFKYGTGRLVHAKKPDRDNIDKAVLDSLKLNTRLDDDNRITSGIIQKFYAGYSFDSESWEAPKFELWVQDLGPLPYS